MATMTKKRKHTGNTGLFLIGSAIYLGLLILFAWQTWSFVDWLFPSDQVLMKLLTVLCFDIMALFWACVDLFYRFASRGARTLVRWSWAISFILSLLASIFYLVIESMFRFQLTITQQTVNIGYGITIGALTLNILFLTFFLYLEWLSRHPHQDEFEDEDEQVTAPATPTPQPVPAPTPQPVAPQPAPIAPSLNINDIAALIAAMQAMQAPSVTQPLPPISQPLPASDDLYDDLVQSVQPTTEQLPKAQAPAPSGASLNGH